MTDQVCIKRDLSRWTVCHCPRCLVLRRRMNKIRRTGRLTRPNPGLAWARIDGWVAAGFSPAWIATACGLQPQNIESALTERNAGHLRKLGPVVTTRILAADIRTGTAGRCDALVARRRLQALACHGWDTSRLQAACGISFVTLASIRRGATKYITAARHHQIRGVYKQLAGQFGTSTTTKARAQRLGWVPPMGWDDITDPDEDPTTAIPVDTEVDDVAIMRATYGDRVHLTNSERTVAVDQCTTQGLSADQVAELLHVTSRTVVRIRKRQRQWAA